MPFQPEAKARIESTRRRARGTPRDPLAGGVEVLRLEWQPLPHLADCRLRRAREHLLSLEDFDRGENLLVQNGAVVDGELQLGAGPDERPISKLGYVG